eukprot:4894333-Pleurochrysis_carterae.AAC.2
MRTRKHAGIDRQKRLLDGFVDHSPSQCIEPFDHEWVVDSRMFVWPHSLWLAPFSGCVRSSSGFAVSAPSAPYARSHRCASVSRYSACPVGISQPIAPAPLATAPLASHHACAARTCGSTCAHGAAASASAGTNRARCEWEFSRRYPNDLRGWVKEMTKLATATIASNALQLCLLTAQRSSRYETDMNRQGATHRFSN